MDLYDFFLLGTNRLGFVWSQDAAGKGLPAAVFHHVDADLIASSGPETPISPESACAS